MKTRVYTIVIGWIIFLLPIICFAEIVPEKAARNVGINSFSERLGIATETIAISGIYSFTDTQNQPLIYAVNFESPLSATMFISAEDLCVPVLGYASGTSFSLENQPPQLSALLNEYMLQIMQARSGKFTQSANISAEWNRLSIQPQSFIPDNYVDEIPPMINTTWAQGFPYNELCPGGSLVGCVAIAMGQTMKYWGHPTSGEGSHSYTHYNYGYQYANFGATTYAYENMPNNETASNIDLATLLYHCGVAVEMNYSTTSSGSTLEGYNGAANAMKNYFRFDADLYHAKKYQYTESAWRDMVITDLENGFPIIYAGWDGWEGHAWNVDGYEKVGELYHFHINWGWGGSYNGYFYLDDLSPGYTNWTGGQEAIFNLKPYALRTLTCIPYFYGGVTGTTTATLKTQTSLVNSIFPEQGYMMFDISLLPDGATIYATELNGYVYERYKPDWAITPVDVDPIIAEAPILHADIIAEQDAGNYYMRNESSVTYPTGWFRQMLSGTAAADCQAALPYDKFTIGFAAKYPSSARYIKFHGWNEPNYPTLKVYYTAYGNLEGHVFEYGSTTPVADAWVYVERFKDTTDASGYYHFENVPIGNYELIADGNDQETPAGHPLLNDTIQDVAIFDGSLITQDVYLKWSEIEVSPNPLNIPVDPYATVQSQVTLTNNGPGTLEYTAHVSPPMGDMLQNWDIETATGENTLYGCVSDGTYIWATGLTTSYGEHHLYKLDLQGNLLETYPQGTTSQFGMRRMTFDGQYIYSADMFGFYQIDPADGSVVTLFTDFPEGLYTIANLGYIHSLGFVSAYEDEDLFVFDAAGNTIRRMASPGQYFHCNDITYDSIHNCLWLAKNSTNNYYQYDLATEKLTGLFYEVPKFPGCSYQTTAAVFFSEALFPGKTAICGMTYGNPTNYFFAFELESWLTVSENKTGTIAGSAKASGQVTLEVNSGILTAASKSAQVIFSSNAGENIFLPVTITNNYSEGDVTGTITEYGTGTPVENALVTINGQSATTNALGEFTITSIPIGIYDMVTTSDNYLVDTAHNIPVTGITETCNRTLKWTEIDVSPSPLNITLPADFVQSGSFSITNNGPGDLYYNCEIVQGNKSPANISILVVDRDMSCYSEEEEEYTDEWWSYQQALDDNGFSYTYHEVLWPWYDGPDLSTLEQYDLVIWFTGHTYGSYGITSSDENNLADYLDNGGNLFLTSPGLFSSYGWPIAEFEPGDFAYDYLGLWSMAQNYWFIWWGEEANIDGIAGNFASGKSYYMENFYWADLDIPKIEEHDGIELFEISEPSPTGLCSITHEGNGFQTVYSSISFALVNSQEERAELMASVVNHFSGSWLSFTENQSGMVAGNTEATTAVGLEFNTTGLAEDTYNADIYIHSNDANSPEIIPVTLTVGAAALLDLKVWLQGPYLSGIMRTDLINSGLLPLEQPYDVAPWNYGGSESVVNIPNGMVVDWILVEYRDAPNAASATPATRVGQQAAFLLEDGSITDLDGSSPLLMTAPISEQLFVVIHHRNHLGIMSSGGLTLNGGYYSWDFSSGATQAYGGSSGHSEAAPGIWAMTAGNANGDSDVNDLDESMVWETEAGKNNYLSGDLNLDRQVNNSDKNDYWYPNRGAACQVPE